MYLLFSRMIPSDPTESHTEISPGVIAAIVVVLAIIAVVIGILVFFVQRYYASQARIRQNNSDYLTTSDPSPRERRGSNQSVHSVNSHADVDGSYSDLASYHSDIESYPVSSGRYSSQRESLHSELGGVDNMAYSLESKGSVTSSSSATPSVMYVSTINVKGRKKPDGDSMSVQERVKIINTNSAQDSSNTESAQRKISCNSDDGQQQNNQVSVNGLMNGISDTCNEPIPHQKEDELTVTTIGIRDRTSSEITISTIHARNLRQRLEEKKRVKSQDDVNIKPASHSNTIMPLHKTRFAIGNVLNNRDSIVTISTVSSKDRSMSDVTISTLSKNSVYMGSGAQIANGGGEINRAFQKDNAVTSENKFSSGTLSTVLSAGDQTFSEDDNDSVFVNKEDPSRKISQTSDVFIQDNADTNRFGNESTSKDPKISSQESPMINGVEQTHETEEPKSKISCKLNRTGSVQSKTSEVSCSHNHENHRKKSVAVNVNGTRLRNMSSSSEDSLSSNGCSECDSCPYCRDCASVMSEDIPETNNNSSEKFVSIVNTEKIDTKVSD